MSAPALSLVLVVHREQAWLPELAASLLGQDFAAFELVAIDDASPDHAPALLDELAERDRRVRVRHLPERVGLGPARNLALELVEGDHVWFVETTDLLPAGALARVAERLRASSPELLHLGYVREDVFGRRRAAVQRGEAQGAWNKVFASGFLRGLGVSFGEGAFDELSVTWPALLAASRVETLERERESYVRRRPPNAVRHGSPFDVFNQYDAVFAFEAPDERRRQVLPAMLRHELSLLARLPEAKRAEFFACMSESVRRHRGGDEPPLSGRLAELRARLVERGDYRSFRTLERTLELRSSLSPEKLKAPPRRLRRRLRLRPNDYARDYQAALRRPLEPDLAVFAAYWYRGYSCNPRAIYEKARELVPGFHGVWVASTEGARTIPDGVDYVMAGTPEYFDLISRAAWFVNNVNFPNHMVKREGTVHVMTHHGTPLKKMGLDLRNPDGSPRPGAAALLRRCSRWDFSISQNEFTTPIWERVYPTRYESLEVGYPRNDVLALAGDDETERARSALGIEPGRRALLYAPTHREYLDEQTPMLDLGALVEGLGEEFVLLARSHYFYDSDPVAAELHRRGRLLDVTGHPSIEELYLAADVLVTDYSSAMFDYAVLDRPIVIHAPDWDEYRTRRGTYFDLMAEPPGALVRTERELIDALRSGADDPAARAAFRTRFCSLDDGHAAERVVRRVWLGEREALERPAQAVAP